MSPGLGRSPKAALTAQRRARRKSRKPTSAQERPP
eukprot:CAMPEP_0115474716 /NCGR_PEP_ID=MMETSP0271-20121206/54238_1 /TAXON_ID=71861 /ORGANISM="Scrippsiella trochoidea, Strain CCMP3099" /LENGTH=34 /DNA_ID= /DNA_START= /DNA_END= /DNA_ORIENTATION=